MPGPHQSGASSSLRQFGPSGSIKNFAAFRWPLWSSPRPRSRGRSRWRPVQRASQPLYARGLRPVSPICAEDASYLVARELRLWIIKNNLINALIPRHQSKYVVVP